MTKAEKEHLNKLAEFGCAACFIDGFPNTPCEIHHPRAGVGKGQRASHYDAVGLCAAHHRGTRHPEIPSIHLAKRAFIAQYGTEAELLEVVRQHL